MRYCIGGDMSTQRAHRERLRYQQEQAQALRTTANHVFDEALRQLGAPFISEGVPLTRRQCQTLQSALADHAPSLRLLGTPPIKEARSLFLAAFTPPTQPTL